MFGSRVLDKRAHTSRPWRIHTFTKDFRVLDVWSLPTPGGPDDFAQLVDLWSTFDPGRSSPVVRSLFAIRWTIGRILGLDRPETGLGVRVHTLRDRIPDELLSTAGKLGPERSFEPLYRTDDEFAMEIANQTVHGVMHLGWVPDTGGRYRGQMAVLVKPNGGLGVAYLAAIAPFRHLIVYPAMMRDIGRVWRERPTAPSEPANGDH
jgi:hypothetical protein